MSSDKDGPKGLYCCTVPMDGVRMLTFPDGTKSGVVGLNEILSALYLEGREANSETAEDIVERLSVRNYIVPSAKARYAALLLEEYERYVQTMGKTGKSTAVKPDSPPQETDKAKGGIFSKLFKGQ